LTSNTYRRSALDHDLPHLVVTTTLLAPSQLTVETRGQTDSGTILDDGFRAELFNFYDLTSSKPVVHELFPGTCDASDGLELDVAKELHASRPVIARRPLYNGPLSEPVDILEPGHEYRLTLKPQRIRCWEMSVAEILGDSKGLVWEEMPEPMGVVLACDDELLLKVEA
jgi:hypothetical protein